VFDIITTKPGMKLQPAAFYISCFFKALYTLI
jgi:hypothetical protein